LRFPLAALLFIILSFIFLVFWAFTSLLIGETSDALTPSAPSGALSTINLLPTAFGIICVIFFITGILLIFILDSFAEEPELYWRRY